MEQSELKHLLRGFDGSIFSYNQSDLSKLMTDEKRDELLKLGYIAEQKSEPTAESRYVITASGLKAQQQSS